MSLPFALRRLPLSSAASVLVLIVLGIAAADLGRTLWRVHLLMDGLRRDDTAISKARHEISGVGALRARRDHLRTRLQHGARPWAGAWLVDLEYAAELHGIALLAVRPVDDASDERQTPARFTRRAAEVQLRGDWRALARWVGDLGTMPGTVAVGRFALEPARDVPGRALDARAVVVFYMPAPAKDSVR